MPNPILDKITIDDIEYDLVGNGGGHVIEKSDGTDMTQRSNLQFVDAQLTDDSTNDRTKIENVKIIQNESELANLPDGIYMGAQDEAVPFSFEAEDISYDNTTSQLTATDVQAAIDELSQKEAGVQSDWNEADNTKLDYIKNKPANLVQDASYVHTDNNYTSTEKTKLGTIAEGAEVNVQSDWSQTDNTADDYIKNKPTIPDAQIQSDWNQTSGTAKDFIKNKPTLGTASALDVATSGDASSTQVVKGDDSRLSDARTPVSHTHTLSEITDAGTAASKDSTSSVTADSTDLVESGAVKTAIDNAISGAYKHAGTKTCAELISSLLIASNNGNVYNITDSGTTTADFIEGAGIPIRAGDNVGIAKISDSIYKFDLLSGFIDTSNFVTKSSTSGLIKNDGSIDTTEYAPASSVPAAQIQSDWSQSDNTKLDYIKNKPTLGSAASKNVPSSGDAGNSEVVLGNDTRLTDARNAADVYSWAKAENKPSYTKSEVGLGNVDNTSDATKKSNFTGSIASGNTGFVTGGDVYNALDDKVDKVDGKGLSTNDYTNTDKGKVDSLGTASTKDIPTSGNASTSQVVMGSDTRLTDARPASDVSAWAKASTKPSYTKAEVGLGNVDNTSDANKPISTATQTALDNKVDKDGNKVLSTNDYTTTEKNKLAGIAEGAEVNVQSDWDETDDTQDDYIKNKPEAYDAIWQNNDILEGVSDIQPYLYRATNKPEGAIEYVQEKLIGASAAVNQLVQNGNFESTTGWECDGGTISVSNNSCTFTTTVASANDGLKSTTSRNITVLENHKYLIFLNIKLPKVNKIEVNLHNTSWSLSVYNRIDVNTTNKTRIDTILSIPTTTNNTLMHIYPFKTTAPSIGDVVTIENVNLIDLTQMFGTAIADLAYSKEQASAGSGIAWLKSYGFFTKDYYPYNAGALQSVKTGSKKVVGKNLASKITSATTHTQYSMCLFADGTLKPSTTYVISFKGTTGNIIYPNEILFTTQSYYTILSGNNILVLTTKAYISKNNASQYSTANQGWILFKNAVSSNADNYFTEVMIEEGSTATSYEPYTSTTYPLDSNLELRGLYKLDTNNNIVCDGDKYTPDGSVKRRYGIINLGNKSWTYDSEYVTFYTSLSVEGIVGGLCNLFCSKYTFREGSYSMSSAPSYPNKIIGKNSASSSYYVYIKDTDYTDATAFKTAMSGVYLIYELATPTTDAAASYQNPQIIHENGTEEFIDTRDFPLPIGHNTSYFTASDEKFFLPPVVDNDGRFLYHDGDGFQFKNFNQVASKVEESDINGNIKIDGTEAQVYDDSELQSIVDTDTTTATGNPLNFSIKSAQNAVNTDIVIDPVQDLHGYSKPWVGGAGKNLIGINDTTYDILTLIKDSDGNTIGLKINGTKSTPTFYNLFTVTLAAGTYILSGNSLNSSINTISIRDVGGGTIYLNDIGSGATGNLNAGTYSLYLRIEGNVDNKIFYPMLRLASFTDPSFEPYTNICPISPKEQITVQGCGKNLYNKNDIDVISGYYLDYTTGEINSHPSSTWGSSGYIRCKSNATYILSGYASIGQYNHEVCFYNKDKSFISGINTNAMSITTPNNTDYIRFDYKVVDIDNIQIELGNQATSYEPYTPSNNLQIPLPNDFYGGTLNLESGELVVDRGYTVFDGSSDENWELSSAAAKRVNTNYLIPVIKKVNANVKANITSNQYYKETSSKTYSGIIGISVDTSGYLAVADGTNSMSVSGWINSLNSNPLQVVYELATPYTIHLTPHQLNLLKATNNISTDAKTISVTYRNGELSTYAPATDIADGLLTATDKRAIDRTSDIVEGNPIQFSTESKQIARSTIIDLEPIQDLHGFTKPWVGGSGKNLLPLTVDGIKSVNTAGTWSGDNYNINGVTFFIIQDNAGNITGIDINTGGTATTARAEFNIIGYFGSTTAILPSGSYTVSTTNNVNILAGYSNSAYANTTTERTDAYDNGMSWFFIRIESGSNLSHVICNPMARLSTVTDSTFVPYTNICPISGYDQIDVLGCGKNVADVSNAVICTNVIESLADDGTITFKDVSTSTWATSYIGYFDIVKGQTYTIKGDLVYGRIGFTIDPNVSPREGYYPEISVSNPNTVLNYVTKNNTFVANETQRVYLAYCTDSNNSAHARFQAKISIVLGNELSAYTPYQQSNNLSIQLDNTVYGGKLDVEKGELVVDYAIVDLSTLDYSGSTPSSHIFRSDSLVGIINPPATNMAWPLAFCDSYYRMGYTPISASDNGAFAVADKTSSLPGRLVIIDHRFSSTTDFTNEISGQMMCYELSTPTTIQLSPHAINLLKGVNTITTNGTSITLNYRNGEMATLEDVQNLTDLLMKLINNLSS